MHIYNKNTLFYWVKCTSLFIAIEERDSERTERIGANRSIQNKQQRGFLFGRNAKNPLKHWGFLKSKRATSRRLSVCISKLAEREGFEPPEPCDSTVFKTAAFNRSATSPEKYSYFAASTSTASTERGRLPRYHASITQGAMKSVEYVPASIPMKSAKAKSCIAAPPKK